ncbi:oxygenase MpaB family protein [Nocardia cyriacigeorgica]|jgi:uncharacterized protein (DUF2236 family)|uniref:oxygenase MpaB family protein n=1 Tax=Nocardia cyriacigeorgica TaxID=135487 RepID=UPI000CEA5476|nr:oxygenase MpaB family protein [Nocardia cyriacigeorgica]AVH25103.1 DUF2236 domain-containing protein [Nocardia cyriacigeorgica]MBF6321078.1 DUF2236 domain-containing protein [Nocardia cyriacigeorgica]MBF6495227.1 DUF2236 domain-containing protein [Nocardia cyriacigeorgica]PPJ12838.1 DUF2236 domain-containing protein [Nocardia cyriacigeorgica]
MPDRGQGVESGSLLRRHLGDRRFLLALPRAVTLQILDPAIATAFVEHVPYRLWWHKRRTVLQMIRLVYDERDGRPIIRYGHEHVKGRDQLGRRYHALHPKLFHFQHATYVDTLFTAVNTFDGQLSDAEHEQLYAECCDWYRLYGVSTRYMPETWAEFQHYFAEACATRLRLTPHGAQLASQALRPDAWVPRMTPSYAIRGLLHKRAAELLGVTVSARDRASLRAYAATMRSGARLAPRSLRYVPIAR